MVKDEFLNYISQLLKSEAKPASKYLIYGLVDSTTNTPELRYIGRSSSGLSRPKQHFTSKTVLSQENYCHKWIRQLVDKEAVPLIIIFETFFNSENINDVLNIAEEKWYNIAIAADCRLTNLDKPGIHRVMSEETKKKIGRPGEKNKNFGKKLSEKTKEKMRISHIGMFAGEKNPCAKLNIETVLLIYQKLANGESAAAMARELGIGKHFIDNIKYEKKWSSVIDKFIYKNI